MKNTFNMMEKKIRNYKNSVAFSLDDSALYWFSMGFAMVS